MSRGVIDAANEALQQHLQREYPALAEGPGIADLMKDIWKQRVSGHVKTGGLLDPSDFPRIGGCGDVSRGDSSLEPDVCASTAKAWVPFDSHEQLCLGPKASQAARRNGRGRLPAVRLFAKVMCGRRER